MLKFVLYICAKIFSANASLSYPLRFAFFPKHFKRTLTAYDLVLKLPWPLMLLTEFLSNRKMYGFFCPFGIRKHFIMEPLP